jgi:hypothetical protein
MTVYNCEFSSNNQYGIANDDNPIIYSIEIRSAIHSMLESQMLYVSISLIEATTMFAVRVCVLIRAYEGSADCRTKATKHGYKHS